MKMIRAVIRPETESTVTTALVEAGFPALTKWDVTGRGKQQGIQLGDQVYEGLAKCMLLLVIHDDQVGKAISTIVQSAFSGNPGDGKVFVTQVDDVYTVRSGKSEL
ncbi:MAG: P-II family nitrogen regulator [Chloroflexi bacterium]|nr:P-II family nitrogen regulator [Chloroflexota bacterium]